MDPPAAGADELDHIGGREVFDSYVEAESETVRVQGHLENI